MLENHNARVLALQTLYNEHFRLNTTGDINLVQDLSRISGINGYNKSLFDKIIKGISNHKAEIEAIIIELAPERPLKDINPVELVVIEIAIFEGFIEQITPPKVAINEAIELSKIFGGENSSKFISGVLGNLYKQNFKHAKPS